RGLRPRLGRVCDHRLRSPREWEGPPLLGTPCLPRRGRLCFLPRPQSVRFRPVSHLAFLKNGQGLRRMTRGPQQPADRLAKGKHRPPERGISDVIEWVRERDAWHPNQKPVQAMAPLLSAYAPEGGLVLDPFMGSGSTLRAAKDQGLCAVGIEIEEGY